MCYTVTLWTKRLTYWKSTGVSDVSKVSNQSVIPKRINKLNSSNSTKKLIDKNNFWMSTYSFYIFASHIECISISFFLFVAAPTPLTRFSIKHTVCMNTWNIFILSFGFWIIYAEWQRVLQHVSTCLYDHTKKKQQQQQQQQ